MTFTKRLPAILKIDLSSSLQCLGFFIDSKPKKTWKNVSHIHGQHKQGFYVLPIAFLNLSYVAERLSKSDISLMAISSKPDRKSISHELSAELISAKGSAKFILFFLHWQYYLSFYCLVLLEKYSFCLHW